LDIFAGKLQKKKTNSSMKPYFSIANNQEKIKEILQTFGKKSRPLILAIIEQDCATYHRRHKRTAININRNDFARTFLRNINDHYH
jgi:hypothetical protein